MIMLVVKYLINNKLLIYWMNLEKKKLQICVSLMVILKLLLIVV